MIFLHGLGDTGHGWSETMSGELQIKGVRYVCPTAPSIPVTINMGMRYVVYTVVDIQCPLRLALSFNHFISMSVLRV